MPIFRIKNSLVYFCHVPKCGGNAITRYIKSRFGVVAFVDEGFLQASEPWNQTSPQHISADDLARLFPASFFDSVFSVVRHPVSRMISEYHYLREIREIIPQGQTFSEWLATIPDAYAGSRWVLDNHLRPMCEIVPTSADVFKLENGLDQVVRYLDQLAGNATGPRSVERFHHRIDSVQVAVPTEDDIAFIERFYSNDYDCFNYERHSGFA